MAYNLALAERIRGHLIDIPRTREKKMFGGIAFMVNDHMCVGVIKDDLCARVGKEQYGDLSEEPGARPMAFTGRPMTGWLFVGAQTLEDDAVLKTWIGRCLTFVQTLPPKT